MEKDLLSSQVIFANHWRLDFDRASILFSLYMDGPTRSSQVRERVWFGGPVFLVALHYC